MWGTDSPVMTKIASEPCHFTKQILSETLEALLKIGSHQNLCSSLEQHAPTLCSWPKFLQSFFIHGIWEINRLDGIIFPIGQDIQLYVTVHRKRRLMCIFIITSKHQFFTSLHKSDENHFLVFLQWLLNYLQAIQSLEVSMVLLFWWWVWQ